nr:periplasmic heavy metal sensor [uncultured Carboxylicivirga sp.]
MKTKLLVGFIAIAMVAVSTTAQAQRRSGNKAQNCVIQDNLTQDQQDKVNELRIAYFQKTKDQHNELNELQAKKHTLETTEPLNKEALYNCLASINSIQTQLQKERIRHYQDVKANLTDDQIVLFDARRKGSKGPMNQGNNQMRNGKGQGQSVGCSGKGMNRGNGQRGKGQGMNKGNGQGQGRNACPRMGQGQGKGLAALNLNDEQKAFMESSRLELLKKEQGLKNQLNELDAQLKTQTTGKNIDLKKVDKTITEQGKIRLQLAQIKADHRIEVRNQLTDEQKMAFDTRGFGHRGRHGRF